MKSRGCLSTQPIWCVFPLCGTVLMYTASVFITIKMFCTVVSGTHLKVRMSIKKYAARIMALGVSGAPLLAFAATVNTSYITDLITAVGNIVSALIPVLISIAVLIFIWGIVQFAIAGDDTERAEGRQKMLWGVVALAVIVALWGLVALLIQIFGLETGTKPYEDIIQPIAR